MLEQAAAETVARQPKFNVRIYGWRITRRDQVSGCSPPTAKATSGSTRPAPCEGDGTIHVSNRMQTKQRKIKLQANAVLSGIVKESRIEFFISGFT